MSLAQVIGLGIGVSGIVGWITYLQVRLKNVESKLIISQQKVTESEILKNIHKLTDTSLDLALQSRLGAIGQDTGPDSGTTGPVDQSPTSAGPKS